MIPFECTSQPESNLLHVVQHALKLMHANDDFESLTVVRMSAEHYLQNPTAQEEIE